MEHYHCELHTGAEGEIIDLWLDGDRGRIEISYAAMGMPARGYQLRCVHQVLSPDFGILVVEQVEARRGRSGFKPVELEREQVPLPLVVEYLRVTPSPVFVHGGTSLAAKGSITPEFSLMLAVYDLDGRPETGVLRELYDHLDKKKLAALPDKQARGRRGKAEPGVAPDRRPR